MKIRTDFVTNSSSSSFVFYSINDRDLVDFVEELIETGKVNDSLNHPDPNIIWGCEACESLELNYSLDITLQIGQMSAAPYSLHVYKAEETGKYSDTALKADCIKMLGKPVVLDAVKSFFDLQQEDKEKLKTLVDKAIEDDRVSCGVFVDETDGFGGYGGRMYSLGELQAIKKSKTKDPDAKKNSKRIADAQAVKQ